MRISSLLLTAVLLVIVVRPTHAGWSPEGVPLCQSHCGDFPRCAPDGAGGAFVAWRYYVPNTDNSDVYMQHVTVSGDLSWRPDLPVCTDPASQQSADVVPDALGGAIVVWQDFRNAATGTWPDIYAQRIQADGTLAPGWVVNGMPVTLAPGYENFPVALPDGTGGAYITWEDRTTFDIYLQHLNGSGVPAPGWPANGLPICVLPSVQGAPELVSDGAGGAIIAWGDLRDTVVAAYAQRVTAEGQTMWASNGVRFILGRYIRGLTSDGAGGVYFTSATPEPNFDGNYYLQRFTGAGSLAPGWPADGMPVCSTSGDRAGLAMTADRTGGLLFTWLDYAAGGDDETFVQRLQGNGTVAPGWPTNGLRLTLEAAYDDYNQVAPDGLGGAYVSWGRSALFGNDPVVVQHVTASGQVAPGWPADALMMPLLPGATSQFYPRVVADDQGGAIVTWGESYPEEIMAQRFGADGPVPVAVSLVSAEASAERVRLLWQIEGAASLRATVERRTENSAWQELGSALVADATRLSYEDHAVIPATRYAYRLGWSEAGVPAHCVETWVDVPRAAELSLEGVRPNPAAAELNVVFSLASAAPATIELLDVSGRQLLTREVGSLGAGRHVLRLDEGISIPAGLYWLRLEQDGRSFMRRAAVVR